MIAPPMPSTTPQKQGARKGAHYAPHPAKNDDDETLEQPRKTGGRDKGKGHADEGPSESSNCCSKGIGESIDPLHVDAHYLCRLRVLGRCPCCLAEIGAGHEEMDPGDEDDSKTEGNEIHDRQMNPEDFHADLRITGLIDRVFVVQ